MARHLSGRRAARSLDAGFGPGAELESAEQELPRLRMPIIVGTIEVIEGPRFGRVVVEDVQRLVGLGVVGWPVGGRSTVGRSGLFSTRNVAQQAISHVGQRRYLVLEVGDLAPKGDAGAESILHDPSRRIMSAEV